MREKRLLPLRRKGLANVTMNTLDLASVLTRQEFDLSSPVSLGQNDLRYPHGLFLCNVYQTYVSRSDVGGSPRITRTAESSFEGSVQVFVLGEEGDSNNPLTVFDLISALLSVPTSHVFHNYNTKKTPQLIPVNGAASRIGRTMPDGTVEDGRSIFRHPDEVSGSRYALILRVEQQRIDREDSEIRKRTEERRLSEMFDLVGSK